MVLMFSVNGHRGNLFALTNFLLYLRLNYVLKELVCNSKYANKKNYF